MSGSFANRDNGDVVVLTPSARGLHDFVRRAGADVAGPIKSEGFAPGVHGFDDAIGDESDDGLWSEANGGFGVLGFAKDSKREAGFEIEFRSVEIGLQVAGIGEGGNAAWLEPRADTGDEAAI